MGSVYWVAVTAGGLALRPWLMLSSDHALRRKPESHLCYPAPPSLTHCPAA